jgi:hypothetical protein
MKDEALGAATSKQERHAERSRSTAIEEVKLITPAVEMLRLRSA